MNILTKAELLLHIARWRATWDKRDIDYRPRHLANPKFISAREAAKKIGDGATVFSSGMAANSRCSIFFWAIKDVYKETGHPKNLTWITIGAQGSRGRVPGTLEELSAPGLIDRIICGHLETVKSLLKAGDEGRIEVHTMPQGVQAFLLETQMNGEKYLEIETALGTRVDPRVGPGTYVGGKAMRENFVEPAGDKLRFHLPPIDYSLFVAPYCDLEGNLYVKHVATYTDAYESSLAARKNGGLVIASVGGIIPKDEKKIFLRADQVDHIIYNPRSEQTGSVQQRKYWPMFTVEHRDEIDVQESVERLRFANHVLKITPVRTPIELATGRLGAKLFTRIVKKGAFVNMGVGLPEEVSRMLFEGGLFKDITLFTETGVVGGLPTPGIFFGAAIAPKQIVSSAQVFHMAFEKLDLTMLGILEVDSNGNVNVSKRGPRVLDYVGPGGLPDLAAAARNILFIGSWMAHAKIEVIDGQVKITKPGICKFMDTITEITFHGRNALAKGKKVYYVTNVGAFQLTEEGMMLIQVMPGIDIQRDILDVCKMKVVLPPDGRVPVVERDIVTGEGFKLSWPGEK
ncbi:MAG: hypothetical protein GX444_14340 [Myxococcales bacterium]|nr:hypothetical protein [Myxococcales bacterium]